MSICRQNFSEEAEAALNAQVNQELTASYAYLSMASWCNRDTVALPGFSAFFQRQSREETEHAHKLIEYLAKRGGKTIFKPIPAPENQGDWKSAAECLETALDLEKAVNTSLLQLHGIADKHEDPQLEDFLEQDYLQEQVESIKEISDMITQLRRCGEGLGLFMFDQEVSKIASQP